MGYRCIHKYLLIGLISDGKDGSRLLCKKAMWGYRSLFVFIWYCSVSFILSIFGVSRKEGCYALTPSTLVYSRVFSPVHRSLA